MNIQAIIKILLPFWLIEILITQIHHQNQINQVTVFAITTFCVSYLIFPYIIGKELSKKNINLVIVIIATFSLSMVTSITVFINYAIEVTVSEVYLGFLISQSFCLLIQIIFSIIGYKINKMKFNTT